MIPSTVSPLRPAGRFRPPTGQPGTPQPVQQPMMPQATDAVTGGASFGPGNDLRSTQINPVASGRLATARTTTDAAGQGVQNFNMGQSATSNANAIQGRLAQGPVAFQGVGAAPSARQGQYAGMTDSAAQGLAGVDRFKLAQERFDQSAKDSQPAYEFANRVATQRAAAGGRLGSGMLRTDYGNLDLARGRELDSSRTRFLQDALEGTIGDQFNKTSALAGLEGQVAGQDAANRGEQRTERNAGLANDVSNRDYEGKIRRDALSMGLGLAGQEAGYGMDRFNAARSAESDAYGQDVGGRQELRGERDYQTGRADKSMSDALAERQQQEREMAQRANMLLTGSQAAGQSSSEDMGALQQALAAYLARRNAGEG